MIGGFHGLSVTVPVSNLSQGTDMMGPAWPFLFITIACGAISGFHSLVAGGTTSKQLARESHAKPVGFGAMLLEGTLAILVLVTIGSSLSFSDYMAVTWSTAAGNPILAFALSVGNLLHGTLGLPVAVGAVFGILTVEGFLITTLDSAVRLNRYLLEEFWRHLFPAPPALLRNFWFNSGLSVVFMLVLALTNGYKLIWPLFGATNQLLAALTLIAVSAWLHRAGRKSWFVVVPAMLMLITTIGALFYMLVTKYLPDNNLLLTLTDLVLLGLSFGVLGLWLYRLFIRSSIPAHPPTTSNA
jgi:carbon starvation protein